MASHIGVFLALLTSSFVLHFTGVADALPSGSIEIFPSKILDFLPALPFVIATSVIFFTLLIKTNPIGWQMLVMRRELFVLYSGLWCEVATLLLEFFGLVTLTRLLPLPFDLDETSRDEAYTFLSFTTCVALSHLHRHDHRFRFPWFTEVVARSCTWFDLVHSGIALWSLITQQSVPVHSFLEFLGHTACLVGFVLAFFHVGLIWLCWGIRAADARDRDMFQEIWMWL